MNNTTVSMRPKNNRRVLVVWPNGGTTLVNRNRARTLLAEGAFPAGRRDGYECIVVQGPRFRLVKVTGRNRFGAPTGLASIARLPL